MNDFSKFGSYVIASIVGVAVAAVILAFSGPSANPPGGNPPSFWQLSGSNMYYNSGSVGIGTSTPSYALDVEGGDFYTSGNAIGGTQLCIGASCWSSWVDIPSGAVMFFNLSSCPTGWSAFTSAQGRYLVGWNPTATTSLDATVGQVLTNQENRPVGQHTHTINDPGHSHTGAANLTGGLYVPSTFDTYQVYYSGGYTSYTGISVNNAGSVAGTNAPYIQFLACKKS